MEIMTKPLLENNIRSIECYKHAPLAKFGKADQDPALTNARSVSVVQRVDFVRSGLTEVIAR